VETPGSTRVSPKERGASIADAIGDRAEVRNLDSRDDPPTCLVERSFHEIIRGIMKTSFPLIQRRQDDEPPPAIAQRGWRYHHIGIPTTTPMPDEVHLPHLKVHVSGFRTSPYGVEWIRFDPDCVVSDLVRTVPHIAFEVDDLEAALAGETLLGDVSSPSEGVRVAMIVDNGAPIELLEFSRPEGGLRPVGKAQTNTSSPT